VELPQTEPVAQSTLLRVVGGVPLPTAALPAVEPTPTPTPAPAGPDVADAPAVASAWLETADDRLRLHVDRLVPTSEGGMRIAGSMAPIDLGPPVSPDDEGPSIQLLPRPGSTDLLVWVRTPDRGRGWLWDGTGSPQPLRLPKGWPAQVHDVAWRPDGMGLAGTSSRAGIDGDFEGVFVVADLGAERTTVIPIQGEYDRLEGWWSSSELRVGHGICTEGCTGRFAYAARLRVSDRRLTQFAPRDRAKGPVDEVDPDGRGGLVMSLINDDPADDIRIAWPPNPASPDGPTFLGFAADHRSLLVADQTDAGTEVYWIEDPARHAIGGRVADPHRTVLGHLPRRGLGVEVAPDAHWALTTDRVETVQLVELATGRSWPIDRDRTLAWWPGA
jgi:hypothetical protein